MGTGTSRSLQSPNVFPPATGASPIFSQPLTRRYLTINGGSSSLKFALFAADGSSRRLCSGNVERIGQREAFFSARATENETAENTVIPRQSIGAVDHAGAAERVLQWIEQTVGQSSIAGIGHRVVHGGDEYTAPRKIDSQTLAELRRLAPLAPQHMPAEIVLIEIFSQAFPGVPQVASFDTAFHSTLPRVARLVPIPRRYESAGVRRYGFHGLSYAYLMEQLRRIAGENESNGRVILAHLGNGASLAAVKNGESIDTSMGFTAAAGLVMGTRTGDIDPGVLVWLLRNERLSADELDDLLNQQSGLTGLSETGSDMRDLLARESSDSRAADAVDLFCYQAKKWIGSFAAALGGLDTLVFSGGIGENAAPIRARICQGLEFFGVHLDESRNSASAGVISTDGSPTTVRVIRTDEELTLAMELQRVLRGSPALS